MTTSETTETKRDLSADLAVCNAATPGNWYSGMIGAEPMAVWYNVIGGPKLRNIADDIGVRENAQFIAEARTGWPHVIERAINAEAEVAQVRALLIGMRKRVKSAEGKWARLREIVATNATGNKGTDINDWDVMLNVMDDIMTGGDGDE